MEQTRAEGPSLEQSSVSETALRNEYIKSPDNKKMCQKLSQKLHFWDTKMPLLELRSKIAKICIKKCHKDCVLGTYKCPF